MHAQRSRHTPLALRITTLIAGAFIAAALAVACTDGGTATPGATPTGTAAATSIPTPTAPAPSAVGTPPVGVTPPAGPTPPAGYAESCAAAYPWGEQVSLPFVCISEPVAGRHLALGAPLEVSGYAGGSFESNVVIEVHRVLASGSVEPEALVLTPLTYVATDLGMPGFWRTTLTLPAGVSPGALRVIARFNSPRDGSLVAEATVDITLQ